MARWCKLIRADEAHPENHTVLLVGEDAAEAATCCGEQWSLRNTDQVLMDIAGKDVSLLYDYLGRQGEEAQSFRFDCLLHQIMAKAAERDFAGLRPVLQALAKPIIAMTQKLYAENKEPEIQDPVLTAVKHIQQQLLTYEQAHAKQTAELKAQLASLQSLRQRES